ncbi:MAG: hypothetical protein ACJAYU_001731 [Bradymonadia bacterium]
MLGSDSLTPEGWRIPTREDFEQHEEFVTDDGQRPAALKATIGWRGGSDSATDLYGFAALPGGYVSAFGTATGAQAIGTWATIHVDADGESRETRTVVNIIGEEMSYSENAIELGAGLRLIRE